MNLTKRSIYNSIVLAIKAYQWALMDMHVWGRENIPDGPKIYVANHITAMDIILPTVFPEPAHVVVGPACKSRIVTWIVHALEQINAMPAHRHTVVPQAVEYLKRGESVFINPEGDFEDTFQMGRFYPGVAKMHLQSKAPFVPIALLAPRSRMRDLPFTTEIEGRIYRTRLVPRGPFCINIGEPFIPNCPPGTQHEQEQFIVDELQKRIGLLVEEIRIDKFWL